MTRFVIVARGPTASRFIPQAGDCIIAVNHAAASVPASWWTFGDVETFRGVAPAGRPRWFVNRNCWKSIEKPPHSWRSLKWEWLGVPGLNGNPCETCFSAVAAIYLAKHLGASTVECFGIVDEHPAPGESPRWELERLIWNRTAASLNLRIIRA